MYHTSEIETKKNIFETDPTNKTKKNKNHQKQINE